MMPYLLYKSTIVDLKAERRFLDEEKKRWYFLVLKRMKRFRNINTRRRRRKENKVRNSKLSIKRIMSRL
jgi:hypothetical protein